MAPDFTPCCHFDEWTFQAAAVLGAAAAEIHAAVISGDTTSANDKLAEMVPAVDAISAEFRHLLGRPARPDLADELFVVTTENPRSVTGPFSSEYSARTFGDYAGGIRPYAIEPLATPATAESDDD